MRRGWKVIGLGAALSTAGGYAMYQRRLKENKAVSATDFHANQGDGYTSVVTSTAKQFQEAMTPAVELYRFQTCPFCGTVQAFLDYCSIPHKIVEVDPMLKSQIKTHGYSKVPQLKFPNGLILVDSDEITNLIGGKMGLKSGPEVEHWRKWARNQLSRYIVLVLNRSLLDSVRAYNYIDRVSDVPFWSKWMLKVVGGPVMYLVAEYKTKKTLQKEYALGQADPQEVMFGEMDQWADSFPKDQKFHGGKEPDMADLDVYGILMSSRYSPLWEDVRTKTKAGRWLEDMESVLSQRRVELK